MTIYVGMDDTDSLESRGTDRLARAAAAVISKKWPVKGVTRHQLYVHESIPFTSHNSCAVLHVDADGPEIADELFALTEEIMLSDFIPGSDPGLAVAEERQILPALIAYGRDAPKPPFSTRILPGPLQIILVSGSKVLAEQRMGLLDHLPDSDLQR